MSLQWLVLIYWEVMQMIMHEQAYWLSIRTIQEMIIMEKLA